MKSALGLFVVFLLAGCATAVHTERIEVPIPVKCEIPPIDSPSLPIDALDPVKADAFEIERALWATFETQQGEIVELRAALNACSK